MSGSSDSSGKQAKPEIRSRTVYVMAPSGTSESVIGNGIQLAGQMNLSEASKVLKAEREREGKGGMRLTVH